MSDGLTLPLVVTLPGGDRTAALMNDKAYVKSRESRVPWVVHPSTGRILPWPGEPELLSLERREGFYEAALGAGAAATPYGVLTEADPEDHAAVDLDKDAGKGDGILDRLAAVIRQRNTERPEGSYTTLLFEKGPEKIRKKTGEEAVELILARDGADLVYEAADLIYHLLVLCEAEGLDYRRILDELDRRAGN